MKFDTTFLRSKVARRMFMLFVFCALLPLTALAMISFSHVSKQLHAQSLKRLHHQSKAVGMTIYERLLFLEGDLKMIASNLQIGPNAHIRPPVEGFRADLTERFTGLALVTDAGISVRFFGEIQNPPELTTAERKHIRSGKSRVFTQPRPDLPSRILMSRAVDPQRLSRGMLLGEINNAYLWGIGDQTTLPPMTELCVLDQSATVLVCSLPGQVSFKEQSALYKARSESGEFDWRHGGEEYVASVWSIPMKFSFLTPMWTVVLSELKSDVLAPMVNFKYVFSLVVLLSLCVVFLLSTSQIRRSLVPLEKLQEGTRRIAMKDFASRVMVRSGDEFEDLAASFNTMGSRLGRQFHALATIAEIDRAILSALDTETILLTVLTRMRDVFPCDCVAVTLQEQNETGTARTYLRDGNSARETLVESTEFTPKDMESLRVNPESLFIAGGNIPPYLAPLARRGLTSFLILPIFVAQRVSGFITLGYLGQPAHSQEDLTQARQLADQVAVALSNAHDVAERKRAEKSLQKSNEQLEEAQVEILQRLALAAEFRDDDTGEHTWRVGRVSSMLAHILGWSPDQVELMLRAAPLHDVGKIGIPDSILLKPGKFTPEEFEQMKSHVKIGANTLSGSRSPLLKLAEVIALTHHERWDGTGYLQLKRDDIPLPGRIVTVADVFDALTHSRRYKRAWPIERARAEIATLAGTQFDPQVVEAFLQLLDREGERLVSGAHDEKFQSELLPRATAGRFHTDLYQRERAMAWQRET